MEEQRYPDNVLYQRIEQLYTPAQDWESCSMPMTNEELIRVVSESLPGFFDGPEKILTIFEGLHFLFERNEHNNKHYWLVNPA